MFSCSKYGLQSSPHYLPSIPASKSTREGPRPVHYVRRIEAAKNSWFEAENNGRDDNGYFGKLRCSWFALIRLLLATIAITVLPVLATYSNYKAKSEPGAFTYRT
jgi:hypothetical protein